MSAVPKLCSDKFLVGKDLIDATRCSENIVFTSVTSNGKATCNSTDPLVEQRVYSSFFRQLHQEHASPECRVAEGHLINGDDLGRCAYLVEITTLRGKFMRKYGFSRHKAYYLYPEEAVYLSECGHLQVYDRGLPLSLQQLCNTIFRSDFEFSCYTAYAWLVRQGFVLRRHETTVAVTAGSFAKDVKLKSSSVQDNPFPTIGVPKSAERQHDDDTNSEFLTASPSDLNIIGEEGLKGMVLSDLPLHFEAYNASASTTSASFAVFNVFDDRTGVFAKNGSIEPDFVLVVMVLGDGVDFLPNKQFRRHFGLPLEAQIVLATVDNGDVYLQCATPFSIPCINQT
ncbi:unnamed protein product [Hydatigera taeniaeformis]|uniref:tRNA_int_end_N2 domain-containing protein n=1 Tax=Hydatigena taeniaeformis TaxID=6205 RepID=A0A0R3WPD7_HYDTA|nr:unnamed protein product [Hydatigera taeniaeformis]